MIEKSLTIPSSAAKKSGLTPEKWTRRGSGLGAPLEDSYDAPFGSKTMKLIFD
ncbi:TPA: hypothetical protein JAL16_000012 [Corynebacterium striatum]|uniref:hypothetical protein n=1 Tax=Corynebacterium striatum TaxID=43770 RepID=UPI0013792404|nr:hypothetical protein [Corynebacterium striatum]MDK8790063.1 hypothetical protein [Corynebacterium striatum]HAT6409608.1 hypothetical protein [Corynebacterium striatum]HAT6429603.1 hypothetical protein [Corynebacterium striatum]HAT6480686.1 hypothetical protein [Corynebacterium striatum]HAT6559551.1 hypothetical protein [Corynebacterium striatum]